MDGLVTPQPIEIRIANVDLAAKLDALGAAIAAVREAHRDEMSPRTWAALHRSQDALAEAILACARPKKAACSAAAVQPQLS
jgi:hypothetical protein